MPSLTSIRFDLEDLKDSVTNIHPSLIQDRLQKIIKKVAQMEREEYYKKGEDR